MKSPSLSWKPFESDMICLLRESFITRDRGVFCGRLAHFYPCRVPRDVSVLGGSDQEDVFEVVEVGPKRQLVQERLPDVGSVF